MRVYRYKKPELTISLTSGGTLADNTTYYMFGFFHTTKAGYNVYYSAQGPVGDTYSFTTNTVEKSVSVAWKTSGTIPTFEDSGSGSTIVNSTIHCLDTGDDITIDSGIYSGTTHTITRIDYDSFTIPVGFSGTTATTWSCEVIPNGAASIKLWMDTFDARNADGTFAAGTAGNIRISHSPFYNGYTSTPVAVSAPFSTQIRPYASPFLRGLDKSYSYIFETGTPALIGNETAPTFAEINDEYVAAGLYPNCRAGVKDLLYYGWIEFLNSTTIYTNCGISVVYGSLNMPDTIFTQCAVNYNAVPPARNLAEFIANDTITTCPSAKEFQITPSDYDATTINAQQLGEQISIASADFDNIWKLGTGGRLTIVLGATSTGSITNAKLYNTYIYSVSREPTITSGYRYMEDCIMEKNDALQYDFLIYTYDTGDGYTLELENITTDRADNLKICRMNTANSPVDYTFYRTGDFYLEDDVDGATITITDWSGNTYNYTSVSGVCSIEVVEQFSYPRYPPVVYNDQIVKNFNINVVKEGYETSNMTIELAKDIIGLTIPMISSVDNKNVIYGSTLYGTTLT